MTKHELAVMAFQNFMDIHPILGWTLIGGLTLLVVAGFITALLHTARPDDW